MNSKRFSTLFLVVSALAGCATPDPAVPRTTGHISKELFASAIVQDTYLVEVRVPPSYDTDAPSKLYPVVFQLDATASFGAEFPITSGFASSLEDEQIISPTIVVGIGYPYTDPGAGLAVVSSARGRFRDYQTQDDSGEPAGADNFLRFLTEELIPHIDAEYRADPARRILSGHSLGGFFSLYTMLTTYQKASAPFRGFIVGDPTFDVQDYRLFGDEQALAATTHALPLRAWMEIARFDGAAQALPYEIMDERLKSDFPGIDYGSELRDTDHPGTTNASYLNGLTHILGGGW